MSILLNLLPRSGLNVFFSKDVSFCSLSLLYSSFLTYKRNKYNQYLNESKPYYVSPHIIACPYLFTPSLIFISLSSLFFYNSLLIFLHYPTNNKEATTPTKNTIANEQINNAIIQRQIKHTAKKSCLNQ